jgi:hypothetical protein
MKDLSLHYTIIELRNLLNRMSFFFVHSLFVISSFSQCQCLYNNLIFWANLQINFKLFELKFLRKSKIPKTVDHIKNSLIGCLSAQFSVGQYDFWKNVPSKILDVPIF